MLPNKFSMMCDVVDSYCQSKEISLTRGARQLAIDIGMTKWKGKILAGGAAKAGVKHVTNKKR